MTPSDDLDHSDALPDVGAEKQRPRRPRGTGMVYIKDNTWMAKWYVGRKPVKRSLGPIRKAGARDGLTKTQAERRLREEMAASTAAPLPVAERVSVADAGSRLIRHLRARNRKPSTLGSYESYLKVHLVPFFCEAPLAEVTPEDVEEFIQSCLEHQSVKSTLNYLGLLHGIFEFAKRRRWVRENPCRLVEKPDLDAGDRDIRFLDQSELDAVVKAAGSRSRHRPATLERAARVRTLRDVEGKAWSEIAAVMGTAASTAMYLYRCRPEVDSDADAELRPVERVLFLTAAMTGLRQGELFALRWTDIDWTVQKVRVRRNYVRGEFGTPKSRRSSRAVPLADRVARELDLLYQRSAYQADRDLVFCHPYSGKPLDRGQVRKHFKAALSRARVRQVRFHDLRHTFGTRCAAHGVPMRTLQEWMGHRDIKTTQIYADYAPSPNETDLVNAAFARGDLQGTKPSTSDSNSEQEIPANSHSRDLA